MVTVIIVSAMFLLVILVAIEAAVPLAGFFLGGIVFPVFAWLLASGMMTVAGLRKNKKGFFKCRSWWKKWNECIYTTAKFPQDSCQFYWRTARTMASSIITFIFMVIAVPIMTIIAIVANLVSGRVLKLRSFSLFGIGRDNPVEFTEEHCRFSPVTMYGMIGIYFLFRFIGYGADSINWESVNLVMPATVWIWMIGIAASVGILILVILWKSELIKKFVGDCWGVAVDLKKAAREKFCIRIVE